ncbi:MAG: PDZ domain-containing protein [Firmicutes bacterium]|nr:PDZ domain-containing protein [Bacillota bacterium]
MNILIAILALNLIVIVHELGHYLVAKSFNIKVLEFSLFFGPKLFSVKKGETIYSLRLFPVGAFVQLEGEEEASDSERSFSNKPLAARAAVVAAGPLMNFLTALLFLTLAFFMGGYSSNLLDTVPPGSPAAQAGLQRGDRLISYDGKKVYQPADFYTFMTINKGKPSIVEYQRGKEKRQALLTPHLIPEDRYILGFGAREPYGEGSTIIEYILPDSPAEQAGLLPGDQIIALDQEPISNKQALSAYLHRKNGEPVTVTLRRAGEERQLTIQPRMEKGTAYYDTGLSFQVVRGSFWATILQPPVYMYSTLRSVIFTLGWLVTGKVSITQLAGPVRIVSIMSEAVSYSPTAALILLNLLNISALISMAIGATNLLPLPALDGGRLLLFGLEALRGKPLPPEKEAAISMLGFVLLMSLGFFVLFNDLFQLIRG